MLETNVLFRQMSANNQNLTQLTIDDIKEIQKHLLEQLDDFDYVCRKYRLQYFLSGGSALGAVRHGGYIPWDEDVDVCMPRKDYEKLEQLMLQEFGDKYWVQSVKTSNKYDLNFMKIRRKGTRYVEIFEADPERAGIFIDIFAVENTYDSPVRRRLQGMQIEFLLLCASCVRIKNKTEKLLKYAGKGKAARLIRIKTFLGTCLSFKTITQWCRLIERKAAKCENEMSKYVSIPSGRKHFFGELYERESLFPPKEILFEGRRYFIMADTDAYLTKLFGDYMKIPAETERERHSIVELKI